MSKDSRPQNSAAADGNNNKHQQLYHWVYVVGFCLLFSAADFVFLWPESHLAALLLMAAAISLIAIYEMTAAGVRPRWVSICVVAIFSVAITASFAFPMPSDVSAKTELRDFLARVDPRIIQAIDSGQTTFTTRMGQGDAQWIGDFLSAPGNDTYIRITGYGRTFTDSAINNGSLGPATALPWQREILFQVNPALRNRP